MLPARCLVLVAAALGAALSLQPTCKVQAIARAKRRGDAYSGPGGAPLDVIAVNGVAPDGSEISGICADDAVVGATVELAAATAGRLAPRAVLAACDCSVLGDLQAVKDRAVTVLGSTTESLACVKLLDALGASVTVVTPRKGGVDDAFAAGAAMAFNPAALDEDADEDEDYGFVLDFAGDEGRSVEGYASVVDADVAHALDWGLGEPRPAAAPFASNDRVAAALAAVPLDFEPPPAPSQRGVLFGIDPVVAAASVVLGPAAAPAYAEALAWPADGETRRRFGLAALAPALGTASWRSIDASLEAGDYDDDVSIGAPAPASPEFVEGDAIVFVTAKFCQACRRMDPHVKRMERTMAALSFFRVDATTDRTFAAAAGVDSTPTFLIYRDGVLVSTVGTASPTTLRGAIGDAFPALR